MPIDQLYASAVGTGCGVALAPEEERVAATDELLCASFTGFVRLGSLATLHAVSGDAACAATLGRQLAVVVRMLDHALAAHGRDNGYDVAVWRERATTVALVIGDEAGPPSPIELIESAAERVACALPAVPRDRLGVPDKLADAIGELLVAYAAFSTGGSLSC